MILVPISIIILIVIFIKHIMGKNTYGDSLTKEYNENMMKIRYQIEREDRMKETQKARKIMRTHRHRKKMNKMKKYNEKKYELKLELYNR